MSFPPSADIAALTVSVGATDREFGPAPTAMPFVAATASKVEVGAGSASVGQGVGRNWMLLSPETPLKPTSYIQIVSYITGEYDKE